MSRTTKPKKAKSPQQVKSQYEPGSWSKVTRRMWRDAKFQGMTPLAPGGQALWLYLLTSPHCTSIPGLFSAREEGLASELGWSMEGFREAFLEARQADLVEADWKVGLVWIRKAIRHDPPVSPNVVHGWGKTARSLLPECDLLRCALSGIRSQIQEYFYNSSPYLEAFGKAFPEAYLEALPKALGESGAGFQIQEQEQEQEHRSKQLPSAVAGGPSREQPQLILVEPTQKRDLDAEVFDLWRTEWHPRANPVLDPARRRIIAKRRDERSRTKDGRERPPAEVQADLLNAIRGWKNDPWVGRHGLNGANKLEQLLGNQGDVDKGLALFEAGPPKPVVADPRKGHIGAETQEYAPGSLVTESSDEPVRPAWELPVAPLGAKR